MQIADTDLRGKSRTQRRREQRVRAALLVRVRKDVVVDIREAATDHARLKRTIVDPKWNWHPGANGPIDPIPGGDQ